MCASDSAAGAAFHKCRFIQRQQKVRKKTSWIFNQTIVGVNIKVIIDEYTCKTEACQTLNDSALGK